MLARKGLGFTSPNPCVGAVIVKGGVIVAEGYHKVAGGPHAEIVAMKEVMKKSGIVSVDFDPSLFYNAELYVTLEPCAHYGKTAPCLNAILVAKFRKVYIGMIDPFKKVNGKSVKALKKAGIDVSVLPVSSELSNELRVLNQPFIKWAKTGMPYVILKAGVSLDGKIATSTGNSKYITGEKARKDAKLERSLCDAVIVGANTVEKDNPELAPFGRYKSKKLLRIVIDSKLKLSLKSKIFRDENVFVACTSRASAKDKARFKAANVKFKAFGEDKVSLLGLLKYLGKMGVLSVFVEGGAVVHGGFCDAGLVDKVIFYIAPKIIGGKDAINVVAGDGVKKVNNAIMLNWSDVRKVGEDIKIEGVVNFY